MRWGIKTLVTAMSPILAIPVPASANMGFVMPPISVPVMIWILILIVGLSVLSGEAVMKARTIRDRGQGDIWFHALGIPAFLAFGLHFLLKSLRVMTGPGKIIFIFAVVAFFQLSRLHSSTKNEEGLDKGSRAYETYLLPTIAAVTVISPVLFWFIGGFTHLFLQVGLTGFWAWYGCRYGFHLLDTGSRTRRSSYTFWGMRVSGYILIPASIIIALGFSNTAYRAFRYPPDQLIRWRAAKTSMDQMRSALAAYAADSETNRYPVGEYSYREIRGFLTSSDLPRQEEDTRLLPDTFRYRSEEGSTYTMAGASTTRDERWLYGSPSGITPESYEYR